MYYSVKRKYVKTVFDSIGNFLTVNMQQVLVFVGTRFDYTYLEKF